MELSEGRTINELLQTLLDLSIIERSNYGYIISDPVMREAAEKL